MSDKTAAERYGFLANAAIQGLMIAVVATCLAYVMKQVKMRQTAESRLMTALVALSLAC